jgi:hypothetical protein
VKPYWRMGGPRRKAQWAFTYYKLTRIFPEGNENFLVLFFNDWCVEKNRQKIPRPDFEIVSPADMVCVQRKM